MSSVEVAEEVKKQQISLFKWDIPILLKSVVSLIGMENWKNSKHDMKKIILNVTHTTQTKCKQNANRCSHFALAMI